MKNKGIGYIRVSTCEQALEGVSLSNQRNKIKSYSQIKDIELIDIVQDAGISAKNLKRDGVQRVIQLAKSKKINHIVVYKLDRMFRCTKEALDITNKFNKWNVAFHSVQETLDTKSAMGKFFFTIMAALAEMERGITSERTRDALKAKRYNKEKTGGYLQFGYDIDGYIEKVNKEKKLYKIPILKENLDEQRVISFIKGLHKDGKSLRYICNELMSKRYRTKQGSLIWYPITVARILKVA